MTLSSITLKMKFAITLLFGIFLLVETVSSLAARERAHDALTSIEENLRSLKEDTSDYIPSLNCIFFAKLTFAAYSFRSP